MSAPAVTFSVEPEVAGDVVYLRVAPATTSSSPRGMLGLRLRVRNNEPAIIRLNRIRVSFPGAPSLTTQFERDRELQPDETTTLYLAPEEAVALPGSPPASVRIELFFDGFDQPKALQRTLRAHVDQGLGGSYRFPGKVTDMGDDEYFTQKPRHTGGAQFFAYDIVVEGWSPAANDFTTLRPGADPADNASYRGWGKPIYAMADGIVLSARDDRDDNPTPGKRSIERLSDASAGSVGALAVTRLSDQRVATAVRTGQGTLKVIIWDTDDDGAGIVRRGDADAGPAELVAADALSAGRLVTAIRRPGGALEVRVWSISNDGMIVTSLSDRSAAAVDTISLVKLSTRRFATATRTAEGALRLMVWEVSASGSEILIRSQAFAGDVRAVSMATLSATQLVTAVRTQDGDLKVIAWAVSGEGALTRQGSANAGAITHVACAVPASGTVATCVRTAQGEAKVILWTVSPGTGSIARTVDASGGPVGAISAAKVVDDTVVTAASSPQGLEIVMWKYNAKGPVLVRWGEADAGAASLVAIDRLGSATFVTAVRAANGSLKLISWYIGGGGGNCVRILHGDEIVLYAHFRKGSIPPGVTPGATVTVGQLLGRMGNSGSSTGVHLHIHAVERPTGMSIEELIAAQQAGTLHEGPYRPLPFHGAQAMRLSSVHPAAAGPNPFFRLAGHGLYFDRMAIWPGLTTPGVRIQQLTSLGALEPSGKASEATMAEGDSAAT